MPALAERFTVVAPDLLGHGGSDKPGFGGRVLARGPCHLSPRPAGRARARAGHRRRPVARRRRGDAVRVSVPGALRAPGAGGQRRAGAEVILPPDVDRSRASTPCFRSSAPPRLRDAGDRSPRGSLGAGVRSTPAATGDLAELRVAGGRREPPRLLSQPARRDRLRAGRR